MTGWGVNGSWIAESGQAFSTLSFADLNGNSDAVADPAYENPNGVRRTGTGVNTVCFSGGTARIAADADGCGGAANVVGYVAQNPNTRFVAGAAGALEGVGLTRTGRGNVISAGINVVSLAFFKNTPVGEGRSVRFGAELMNAFNHSSPSIGNGSARPDSNHSNARDFPGYANPASSQFLNQKIFTGGLGQKPFQRVVQLELKFIF